MCCVIPADRRGAGTRTRLDQEPGCRNTGRPGVGARRRSERDLRHRRESAARSPVRKPGPHPSRAAGRGPRPARRRRADRCAGQAHGRIDGREERRRTCVRLGARRDGRQSLEAALSTSTQCSTDWSGSCSRRCLASGFCRSVGLPPLSAAGERNCRELRQARAAGHRGRRRRRTRRSSMHCSSPCCMPSATPSTMVSRSPRIAPPAASRRRRPSHLRAARDGEHVMIEVEDDGRGIDVDSPGRGGAAGCLGGGPRGHDGPGSLRTDLRARLFHGRRGHRAVGPRRRHGCRGCSRGADGRPGRAEKPTGEGPPSASSFRSPS